MTTMTTIGSGNWRDRAACRTHDPELFFPVGTLGPAIEQTAEAKRVCEPCPVKAACLESALSTGQDYGVWAGMSETERRELVSRRRQRSARQSMAS